MRPESDHASCEENERLEKEVSTQQSIVNMLMKNNEKNQASKKIHAKESKKIYIKIVGDSMLNGFEERGLCKNHRVKVRKHPGAITTD